MLLIRLSPYAQNPYTEFFTLSIHGSVVTQSLCHWWEQTFTKINTNEKPGKLLLKTWLNHCWYG